MYKRALILSVCSLVVLGGCNKDETEETQQITFAEWKLSEDAYDYNNDSRITQEDFTLFINLNNWLEGNEALDMNGDRKIDLDDYIMFNDISNEYSVWLHNNPSDLNSDGIVNNADFLFDKGRKEFIGNYYCINAVINNVEGLAITISDYPDEALELIDFIDWLKRANIQITSEYKVVFSNLTPLDFCPHIYESLVNILNNAELKIHSTDLVEMVFSEDLTGSDLPISFSFKSQKNYVLNGETIPFVLNCEFSYQISENTFGGAFCLRKLG